MDPVALSKMKLHPVDAATAKKQHAQSVADQFETVFVRTMVSSLRQTAAVGEEGMFGAGPGSDTYSDWFDQNLAEQVSHNGHVGIADQLMRDFARYGAIPKAPPKAPPHVTTPKLDGGIDVVLG